MKLPEVLTNFRCYYEDSIDMMGLVDVTLPDIEPLNTSLKGAGILGEVSVPIIGHTGSLNMTINFRTICKDLTIFAKPQPHAINLRGALQAQDTSSNKPKNIIPIRVVGNGSVKKLGLGKFTVGEGNDSSVELELTRFELLIDGDKKIEIDKLNNIYKVDGEDHLADVNSALGL